MNARKLRYVDLDTRLFTRGSRPYAYVRPRYSAGSPSMVTDDTALRVADDEKSDYEHILEGIEGEASQNRAKILGLRGIAYVMAEKGSGKNFRWLIQDLITGELLSRHHDRDIERLGFIPFARLPDHAKAQINKTGRESDYERTFWKWVNAEVQWAAYEPELVKVEDR
jgi:hypothetical protein